jgi:hypothetical protein
VILTRLNISPRHFQLSPWNMLDLTPQGHPNWCAKLEYPERSQASRA